MQYTTAFCDYFTGLEQNSIRRFCKQINETDADVIVLMAHKAVRLFGVLIDQGYIATSVAKKIIISNHAVEFNCEYLKGKKIAIVDDIVISGSSIASLVCILRSIGVRQEDIYIIAIAIDQCYFAMNFDVPNGDSALYCGIELENAACIELSAKISKVFSHYGIPYEADFPTYTYISEDENTFNLFHDSLWGTVYDVSNENQRVAHVSAYSIQPASCMRKKLWTLLGVDLDRCVHLAVRCYIKRFPNKKISWCFLPLCLFEEITEYDLKAIYKEFKPEKELLSEIEGNHTKAQMRYLQFYFAHQLFAVFQEMLGIGLKKQPLRFDGIQLFGQDAGNIVLNYLNEPLSTKNSVQLQIPRREDLAKSKVEEYMKSKYYQVFKQDAGFLENKWPAEQNFWLNHLILSPFLWWYNDEEIPAREQLLEGKFHYIEDQDKIEEALRRLHNGVSFATIRHILSNQFPDIPTKDIEAAIFLFLDRGIDEGVIVPTVYDSSMDSNYTGKTHFLCRIYRHGEDLPFAEADQYRLTYFLYKLSEKIPIIVYDDNMSITSSGISQIVLQKMLVLFYRMGLAHGGIFNRFLGFGNYKILHSFMCLHGAIAGLTDYNKDPNMYVQQEHGEEYITLLSKWLKKESIMISRTQNTEYSNTDVGGPNTICSLSKNKLEEMGKKGESVLSEDIRIKIEKIVQIIAAWWEADGKKGQKSNFKDHSTAVTSCGDIYIYASAIATEVHYFSLFWENQANYALQRKSAPAVCNAFKERDGKRDHLKYTHDITQGLKSGRDKVDWFQEGVAALAIEKVSELLDVEACALWKQTWSNYEPKFTNTTQKLKADVDLTVGYLFFYSACFECICNENFWKNGELSEHFEEFQNKCFQYSGTHLKDDFAKLRSVADDYMNKTVHQRGQDLYKYVCAILKSSEGIVGNIQNSVRGNAPNYTVSYQSALIFEINPLDQDTPDKVLERFWSELPEDINKTDLNILRLPQQENTQYMRYGLFCNMVSPAGNGLLDSNRDYSSKNFQIYTDKLYSVFKMLCRYFTGRVYGIRGILLPSIPIGYFFEHDLKRNMEIYANKFCEQILQPLQKLYLDKDLPTKELLFVCCNNREGTLKISQDYKRSRGAPPEWCTKCEIYDSGIIIEEKPTGDIAANSMVRISCGCHAGWGFLLRIRDRVVCVTCNHVIRDYCEVSVPIKATVVVSGIQFDLLPITPIPQYNEPPELKPADQEVAVLAPCWEGDIPLNLYNILTKDHLQKDRGKFGDDRCRISTATGNSIMWKSASMPMGEAGRGYKQIDEAKHVKPGDSGGIYTTVEECDPLVVFGIHVGVYGDELENQENASKEQSAFMLPSGVILHTIEKIEGVEKDVKRNNN